MKILEHPTVDSELWAEAVEWLLIYGPEEVKELLNAASGHALQQSFPGVHAVGFDRNGNPCYSVEQLAEALDITEEEAEQIIRDKEKKHGISQLLEKDEGSTIQ